MQHFNLFLQHLYETLPTYPKHLKHTLATCAFSATSPCCLGEWRLVDAELDTGVELDAAEWHAALVEKVAPVEKATGAVENAAAGRWPVEREGWHGG
jgi:uncharacterized protein YdaU (DUF1376 family)